jgi:hypothetical protein
MKKQLTIAITSITVVFILMVQLFFNMMARDKMDESLTKHSKEFAVTSDKHLYLVFALVIAIVSILFAVFQYTNK